MLQYSAFLLYEASHTHKLPGLSPKVNCFDEHTTDMNVKHSQRAKSIEEGVSNKPMINVNLKSSTPIGILTAI